MDYSVTWVIVFATFFITLFLTELQAGPVSRRTSITRDRQNSNESKTLSKPRGVFLFDDDCLWYLHGKGQLIVKINCVIQKKQPPVIVAHRRNGKMHYKLRNGIGKLPDRLQKHILDERVGGKESSPRLRSGQIPLKCYYRYDEKGVFYLTTCYTHSRRFGPVEMNFRGHRPGEKTHRGSPKTDGNNLRGRHSKGDRKGKHRRRRKGRRTRRRKRRQRKNLRKMRIFKGIKRERRRPQDLRKTHNKHERRMLFRRLRAGKKRRSGLSKRRGKKSKHDKDRKAKVRIL